MDICRFVYLGLSFRCKNLCLIQGHKHFVPGLTGLGFTAGPVTHLIHLCLCVEGPCAPRNNSQLLKCSPNFRRKFSNSSGTCGSGHLGAFVFLTAYELFSVLYVASCSAFSP